MKPRIGIIGGSGLGEALLLEEREAIETGTPYGSPSDILDVGLLEGEEVAFVPRHARERSIPPHKINHRANLWALKELGVERVLSTSSVGSLKLEVKPRSFVLGLCNLSEGACYKEGVWCGLGNETEHRNKNWEKSGS